MSTVKAYIQSKQLAWSPTTIKSEAARLHSIEAFLTQPAVNLYAHLISKGIKPYTIRTTMVRAGAYLEWLGQPNTFKQFMRTNANLFKSAYQKERVKLTFAEAKKRIQSIASPQAREMAMFLLASGLRAHEGLKYNKDVDQGVVVGKGARMRRIFNEQLAPRVSGLTYIELYTELKKVGLKPHTLRKLAATELVRAGFREAELMHVMGWASMQTASSYLQPMADDVIANKMKEVLG